MKGTIGPNMKNVYELLFPALAEFGLSEEYNRRRAQHRVERQQDEAGTDDREQDISADVGTHSNHAGIDRNEKRTLGEGERAGHLLAPEAKSHQHHAEGKENETEGQEVHGGLSGFGRSRGQQLGWNTLPAAHVEGDEPVHNAGRKFFRPLGDGLIGDAQGLGRISGGTAE